MKALDLFCGAGGASMGLSRAGFEVVGVDNRPQPNYPFAFHRADALTPPVRFRDFDLIWASPPCQRFSVGTKAHAPERYPDLIQPVREMLEASGCAWIIENVPGAPLRVDAVLTGAQFGLRTYRRRHFEVSFPVLSAGPGRPFGPKSHGWAVTCAGHGGDGPNNWKDWADAMEIDWMAKGEMAEAIPPVYGEFLGRQARHVLRAQGGAA